MLSHEDPMSAELRANQTVRITNRSHCLTTINARSLLDSCWALRCLRLFIAAVQWSVSATSSVIARA